MATAVVAYIGGLDASQALLGRRAVSFGEETSAAIYERGKLRAANRIHGPAIVVQMDSTTAIPPGWQTVVDGVGNVVVGQRSGLSRQAIEPESSRRGPGYSSAAAG